MFDTPPVSRDYTYQRQSRLIDSQSATATSRQMATSRDTSATTQKSPEATSKFARTPHLTTRARWDTETHQQTDRETDDEAGDDYYTIDDVRRETTAYCALTTASDTKRMTQKPAAPSELELSQSAEKDYETLPDTALGQPHASSDNDLSSTAAGDETRDGVQKSPGGKRRFCYGLFTRSTSSTSSSNTRTLPRRSKSSSPRRFVSSKTLPRC